MKRLILLAILFLGPSGAWALSGPAGFSKSKIENTVFAKIKAAVFQFTDGTQMTSTNAFSGGGSGLSSGTIAGTSFLWSVFQDWVGNNRHYGSETFYGNNFFSFASEIFIGIDSLVGHTAPDGSVGLYNTGMQSIGDDGVSDAAFEVCQETTGGRRCTHIGKTYLGTDPNDLIGNTSITYGGGKTLIYNENPNFSEIDIGNGSSTSTGPVRLIGGGYYTVAATSGSHVAVSGSTVAVNSCGTGPILSFPARDGAGKLTAGSGVFTACSLNFGKTYNYPPACYCTNESTLESCQAVSTRNRVTFNATTISGATVSWVCLERE